MSVSPSTLATSPGASAPTSRAATAVSVGEKGELSTASTGFESGAAFCAKTISRPDTGPAMAGATVTGMVTGSARAGAVAGIAAAANMKPIRIPSLPIVTAPTIAAPGTRGKGC